MRGLVWLVATMSLLAPAGPLGRQAEPDREVAKKTAVILWVGLAILAVLTVGIGLIWGVSRAARRILRKRPPAHTEMQNVWYLNPPGKRRQDDS